MHRNTFSEPVYNAFHDASFEVHLTLPSIILRLLMTLTRKSLLPYSFVSVVLPFPPARLDFCQGRRKNLLRDYRFTWCGRVAIHLSENNAVPVGRTTAQQYRGRVA